MQSHASEVLDVELDLRVARNDSHARLQVFLQPPSLFSSTCEIALFASQVCSLLTAQSNILNKFTPLVDFVLTKSLKEAKLPMAH